MNTTFIEPKKLPDPDAWPEILQQTRVPVLPDDICRSNYKGKITENMFCAGYEQGGVDACQVHVYLVILYLWSITGKLHDIAEILQKLASNNN